MYYKQNVTNRRKYCCNQQGFSLIELAVVLLVIGVILGGAAGMIVPYTEASHHKATQQKLDRIANALAVFAQSYYTLPCPALSNPTGESLGMPQNTVSPFRFVSVSCSTAGAEPRGIVPFRVLGLTEDDVKDAYGNYISYVVSSDFDQYRSSLGNRSIQNFEVHKNCLTPAWKTGNKMWNMDKAKFCCPKASGASLLGHDTGVGTSQNDSTALLRNQFGRCSGDVFRWNDPSVPVMAGSTCTAANQKYDKPETIAYGLISHGKNGYGAYLRDGTQKQWSGFTTPPQHERGNVTSVSRVIERLISFDASSSGANYFDDIVLWRTNHQIISTFGNDSCDYP